MMPRRRRCFSWVILGLLSVWLVFGSLAFAEEVNLLPETGTQDEAALSEIASTLKSDGSLLEERAIRWVTALVTATTCFFSTMGVCPSTCIMLHARAALRPHQVVSVYRI
ncbi:MAG: hypothetical protein ABI856_14715 [Nitrospira sp.]